LGQSSVGGIPSPAFRWWTVSSFMSFIWMFFSYIPPYPTFRVLSHPESPFVLGRKTNKRMLAVLVSDPFSFSLSLPLPTRSQIESGIFFDVISPKSTCFICKKMSPVSDDFHLLTTRGRRVFPSRPSRALETRQKLPRVFFFFRIQDAGRQRWTLLLFLWRELSLVLQTGVCLVNCEQQ
jgi:hypothetical protein